MRRAAAALAAALVTVPAACGGGAPRPAQQPRATTAAPTTTVAPTTPAPAPRPVRERLGRPRVVARGIPFATNVAFDPRGRMWVTSGAGGPRATDGVWFVPRRGRPRQVASALTTALGLRWAGGRLYVGHITTPSRGRVTVLSGFDGTRFRRRGVALDGLAVGRHTVDSIVRGPSGRLFVGVGSTRDNSGLPGRVLSFAPHGHRARLEATGLRNPYGLAFSGRRLLVTDNGRDDLGLFGPHEELNAFDPAGRVADFGFPGCYDQGGRACRGTQRPLAVFPAHASSDGLAVDGRVAYVAENGSSFAANATGNDVRRVDLDTGRDRVVWRSGVAHDPLGAAIGPDRALYVTLFASGRVLRFARRGDIRDDPRR